MPHFVVTETLEDPSLNPLWVGEACDALHALDQWADADGWALYSDLEREEPGQWVGATITHPHPVEMPAGSLWAIFTNTTVYAIPFDV